MLKAHQENTFDLYSYIPRTISPIEFLLWLEENPKILLLFHYMYIYVSYF